MTSRSKLCCGAALLALGAVLLDAAVGRAATFTLDGSAGADYDAVGDGWFFTSPPNQPPDGVGDAGGNALAIAYQAGVLEMRAMAEFPLASLGGVAAADVESATLTFRIDDVIGTFGPGSAFDGTASDPIAVYAYPADGTVTVDDFSPAGLTSLEIVSIGVISDASLASSGPVDFTVDVTQLVKDSLTADLDAVGILFGTLDSPTATSLDDAAPGVGGVLPFITIETAPTDPPVFGKNELKCQTAIAKQGGVFAKKVQLEIQKCLNAVLGALSKGKTLEKAEAKCLKGLDEANAKSVVERGRAAATKAIARSCSGVAPADVGSPCDAGAADIAATTACVLGDHREKAGEMVGTEYRDACLVLGAVGLESALPSLCN